MVLRALQTSGQDAERIAVDAGVHPRHLRSPAGRVPQPEMTALWHAAVGATGNPCFGLDASRFVTPATFGALTHAVFASSDLLSAFARLVRYQRLMTDAITLRVDPVAECYRLSITPISTDEPPAAELDAFTATWVRYVRGLAWNRRHIDPVRISRRRRRPRTTTLFKKVFRSPITFGAGEDFIDYDKRDCEIRLTDGNPALAERYDRIVASEAARMEGSSTTDKVRALLLETMSEGPTESRISGRLRMSNSSLKACLRREGTTFRTLLDASRVELARLYLAEVGYSIKEIAFLLGYADVATFTRACKRWTGRTPGELRDAQRTGESPARGGKEE